MAVLEGLVILIIVLVGVWVGYVYWDDYIHNDDYAKAHHHTDEALPIMHEISTPKYVQVSWH